jgi:DNA-binding XRE family transcriptional regulator
MGETLKPYPYGINIRSCTDIPQNGYRANVAFTPPPETPGERVRRQRRRLGLEVRDLAAKAGVNKETIVRVENDGTTREATWVKLAEALDAPVEWLRDGHK